METSDCARLGVAGAGTGQQGFGRVRRAGPAAARELLRQIGEQSKHIGEQRKRIDAQAQAIKLPAEASTSAPMRQATLAIRAQSLSEFPTRTLARMHVATITLIMNAMVGR